MIDINIETHTLITYDGVEITKDKAIALLTDKSEPLNNRWALYCELVDHNVLTSDEGYGHGFIETLVPGGTLYDHFHMERGMKMTYPDMLERAEDTGKASNVEDWKEEVLAAGDASFTNDW